MMISMIIIIICRVSPSTLQSIITLYYIASSWRIVMTAVHGRITLTYHNVVWYQSTHGVVCVELAHFSSRWLKGYIYSSCYYHQIGSIHLSRCYHIFPWFCAWDVCYIIFCHLLHIRPGRTGNLFSSLLCSLWWLQIFGYVLACRSYSFVCTVHHLIIIIVQTYLKALNL